MSEGDLIVFGKRLRVLEFSPISYNDRERNESVPLHRLCKPCQRIQESMREEEVYDHEIKAYVKTGFVRYSHMPTMSTLKRSYKENCHLCTLLWKELQARREMVALKYPETRDFTEDELMNMHLLIQINLDIKNFISGNSFLQPFLSRLLAEAYVSSNKFASEQKKFPAMRLIHKTAKETKAYPEAWGSCTASDAAIKLASSWLLNCKMNHPECSGYNEPYAALPKRLLDTRHPGGEDLVRVVLCSAVKFTRAEKYLTLSYCWGGSAALRLDDSTTRDLHEGISLTRLPKTLLDAVIVTRRLGFRWLWIDSLCIMQDSFEEWATESNFMGSIYRNSFLTIAALGASKASEGLFSWRNPLAYHDCKVYKGESDNTAYASPSALTFDPARTFQMAPLRSRGWVVQELLLSPRTLYFGGILFYECRRQLLYESHKPAAQLPTASLKREFLRMFGSRNSSVQQISSSWTKVLEHYSRMNLTMLDDRLAAASGLIRQMEKVLHRKYYAGISELDDLFWSRDDRNYPDDEVTLKRIPGLPSWSWAGWAGPIKGYKSDPLARPLVDFSFDTPLRAALAVQAPNISLRLFCILHQIKRCPAGYQEARQKQNQVGRDEWDYDLQRTDPDADDDNDGDVSPAANPVSVTLDGEYFEDVQLYFAPMQRDSENIVGLALRRSPANPFRYERVGFARYFCGHSPGDYALDPVEDELTSMARRRPKYVDVI